MKKLLALLLAVLMLVSVVTGCSSENAPKTSTTEPSETNSSSKPAEEATAEDIVIRFGVFETDNLTAEIWQTMIDSFEADNPGIKVEKVLSTSSDFSAFWKTMLSSGNFPDVLVQCEDLAPMEGVFAEVPQEIQNLFEENALCQYNGKIVTIPATKQYKMQCYYNKAIFADLGLEEPTTWQEFLNVCQTIKDAGMVPMLCGGAGDTWTTGEPFWICEGNVGLLSAYPDFNEQLKEGSIKWNNPIAVDVLTEWQEMIENGYYYEGSLSLSYPQTCEEFLRGTAAMLINGSWYAAELDATGNEDIGVFAMPSMDGSQIYASNYTYWGVSETCEHKDAAYKFIKYVFSDNTEVYKNFLKADGQYSATKTPVTYEQGPVMNKFVANVSDWTGAPEIVKVQGEFAVPSGMSDFMCKSFQNIFNGADVAAELDAWDAEYQRLLQSQ